MNRISTTPATRLFFLCMLILTIASSAVATPGAATAHTPTDPLNDDSCVVVQSPLDVTCRHVYTSTSEQVVVTTMACRVGQTGRKGTQEVTRKDTYEITTTLVEEFEFVGFNLELQDATATSTMTLLDSQVIATGTCTPLHGR